MSAPERSLPDRIGRYTVVRLLGRGAMGRVLLAHDPVLDRDVAIKLLRDDLGIPPELRDGLLERMRQEARASARVGHPNIVLLHDMGEEQELGLYLVFEHVPGPTLKDRLSRGALEAPEAATLARQLGDALATAHAAGVLHRDIKPENVILSRSGAKIADFGIARVPDSTLTREGKLLGTPAYSAPEAIAGGVFSPASDQFSMAATLYEALSGRRAFPGDDAVAVASRIATEEPPRIAEACRLDPSVDTILARAFAKSPRSRFASTEEFGRALGDALVRGNDATRTPSAIYGEPARPGSRGARIAVGAAALGALAAIVGVRLLGGLPTSAPAAPVSAATGSSPAERPSPVAWLAERPAKARSKKTPAPIASGTALDAGAAAGSGALRGSDEAGAPDAGRSASSATPSSAADSGAAQEGQPKPLPALP